MLHYGNMNSVTEFAFLGELSLRCSNNFASHGAAVLPVQGGKSDSTVKRQLAGLALLFGCVFLKS